MLRLAIAIGLGWFRPATPVDTLEDVERTKRVAAPVYHEAIAEAVEDVGRPDLAPMLWRICRRESWCGRYGVTKVHARDAWVGGQAYRARVARGDLDPEACAAHRLTADRPAWAFATRGGFGQIAAGVLHALGPCVGPEALDDPKLAALAAARTAAACKRWDGEAGNRYRRPCTCRELARRWTGGGRWDARTNLEQRRATVRQCGPQPELTLVEHVEDLGTIVGRIGRRLYSDLWRRKPTSSTAITYKAPASSATVSRSAS